MKTQSVLLKLEPEFVGRIDEVRGDVPRTVWIRRACEVGLGGPVGTTRMPVLPKGGPVVVAEVGTTILRGAPKPDPLTKPAEPKARQAFAGEPAAPFKSRLKGEWKAP